jgi:hypothetical protein
MYQDKETGHMHFTREDLLDDPERLQSFYNMFGKERMINWILKKETVGVPQAENAAPAAQNAETPENKENVECPQN